MEGSTGSLSDDDGDGNKNGKKIIRITLISKATTSHVHYDFYYTNLFDDQDVNCLISLVVEDVNSRQLLSNSFFKLRALSICQNSPVGPLPDQSVSNRSRLSPRIFSEKPSPSCIIFRIKVKFSF